MAVFSKFIAGRGTSQLLLDSDGFVYSRKPQNDKETSHFYRCSKNRKGKCPATCTLSLADNSLTYGAKPHNHDADPTLPACNEVRASLKRKAAEQSSTPTQNLLSEVLGTVHDPAVNQSLPPEESLARIVQRSRAAAAGFSTAPEEKEVENFVLPPTCTLTKRDEPFVLFDGKTDKNSRIIMFSTDRNIQLLRHYCNWINDDGL